MDSVETRSGRRRAPAARPATYWAVGAAALLAVFAAHAPWLNLPYFWDEVGTTVPAAQAFGRHFSWHATTQLPALAVSALWTLTSSVLAVRLAMLTVAAMALTGAFLLAIELCGSLRGAPAFVVVAAVLASPPFFTQAMLAQPPVFALCGAVWALWWFLRGHYMPSALVSIVLVWQSPAGWTLPLVLGLWLLFERRPLPALCYAAPLAAWWLGHPALELPHGSPAHMGQLLGQRAFTLLVADGNWLAVVGIGRAASTGWLLRRRWGVAGVAMALFFAVSICAHPMLERDLLPMLPILYTAGVVGFCAMRPGHRAIASVALPAMLAAGLFFNRLFWPAPIESNLALTDFSALQRRAARYLTEKAHNKGIATTWPLAAELRQPALGYVDRPLSVLTLPDFSPATLDELPAGLIDVLVRYSRESQPELPVFDNPLSRRLALRFFDRRDAADAGEIEQRLGLRLKASWRRGGQWVEIYER
jgi:hypothetical protein